MNQPTQPKQSGDAADRAQQHESETVDEGLEESFPASDPLAVSVTRVGTPEDDASK